MARTDPDAGVRHQVSSGSPFQGLWQAVPWVGSYCQVASLHSRAFHNRHGRLVRYLSSATVMPPGRAPPPRPRPAHGPPRRCISSLSPWALACCICIPFPFPAMPSLADRGLRASSLRSGLMRDQVFHMEHFGFCNKCVGFVMPCSVRLLFDTSTKRACKRSSPSVQIAVCTLEHIHGCAAGIA